LFKGQILLPAEITLAILFKTVATEFALILLPALASLKPELLELFAQSLQEENLPDFVTFLPALSATMLMSYPVSLILLELPNSAIKPMPVVLEEE